MKETTNNLDAEISLDRAWHVWTVMTQAFGKSFASIFGSSPSETWIDGISTLSDAQIKRGCQKILTSGREFPPNLSLFMAACEAWDGRPGAQPARIQGPDNRESKARYGELLERFANAPVGDSSATERAAQWQSLRNFPYS